MSISNFGSINIDGFELNYQIKGNGSKTILVIGSSIYYSRVFSNNLYNDFQFIYIDHRGFVIPPEKVLSENDYNLDTLINDIELFRKQLNLKNFIILGHSGHAFLALEYAKKYSQYVSEVIMIAVSPDYSETSHQKTAEFFTENASIERKEVFNQGMLLLPDMINQAPDKRFISFCLAAGSQSWFDYNFDAAELWQDVYTNMQIIDHVWGVIFRDIDITKDLDNFDKPVLLVLGRYDFLTGPPELWDRVKSKFKNITIRIFDRSSHTPQYEEPELFKKELLEWFDS